MAGTNNPKGDPKEAPPAEGGGTPEDRAYDVVYPKVPLAHFLPAQRQRLEAAMRECPGLLLDACAGFGSRLARHDRIAQTALVDQLLLLAEAVKGRDPLEQMLLSQMLWTHLRIACLAQEAEAEHRRDQIETFHTLIERACDTYRRHLRALGEYRSPGAAGGRVTRINTVNQANFARQQIVQQVQDDK